MSLKRSIAHNTIIQIGGKAISTVLGIIAVALMTRSLGAEQFGWYITASGFLQFIGIVSDFGFTVTTSKMLAEPAFDKTKLLNTIFTWRVITALIFNGLAPLLILFFPYRSEIKWAVAIMSLSFLAVALTQVFVGYYRERLKLLLVTLGEILSRLLLVVGIILATRGAWGFLPMMAIITFASVISTAYVWSTISHLRFALDSAISRALFHKMWPTALSVLCNACYLQADRVVLPLYVSQQTVGSYGAAYRVLDIIIQISAILMGMFMPLITFSWSLKLLADFKKYYQMGFDLLAMILLPATAGLLILAEPVMRLVAPEFAEAGTMLRWLSISIFGTCFGMIFGHIALAINRQKEALWIYFSDAILSLIGYFIFIPLYGWQGAIGVTIFSELYAGFFLTLLTIRYSKVRPRLWPLAKIIMASGLMAVALEYLTLPVIPAILLGTLIYFALIALFRVVSLETIKQIFSFKKVVLEE